MVFDEGLPSGTARTGEGVVPFKEVGIGANGVERGVTLHEPTDALGDGQVVVILFLRVATGFGQRVAMGEVVAALGNVAGT